ncbi:MAG: hypothetical protein M1820_004326 [Bogoriella megaspora]|nr:MAG: hypothetical protein M1820_004326 [Bogoriella megaspora]
MKDHKLRKRPRTSGANDTNMDQTVKKKSKMLSKEDSLLDILTSKQKKHNPDLFEKIPSHQPPISGPPPTDAGSAPNDGNELSDPATNPPNSKTNPLPGLAKDLDRLSTTHTVHQISIMPSAKIRNKTKIATEALLSAPSGPSNDDPKPPIVALCARENVASKLITIAEIVKRNLDAAQKPWVQCSSVESKMVEIKRNVPRPKGPKGRDGEQMVEGGGDEEIVDEDEEVEAFETMLPPIERKLIGKPKWRAVPVMTIFLTGESVGWLNEKYGEQKPKR